MTFREVPTPSARARVVQFSASNAHLLAVCSLRVLYDHDAALRRLRPVHASALLGIAAHSTLAALVSAASRPPTGNESNTRDVAKDVFERALEATCHRRDEKLALRGVVPGDSTQSSRLLPFYTLTRARTVRFAAERFGESWRWPIPLPGQGGDGHFGDRRVGPEVPLRSADGTIRGVADLIVAGDGGIEIEELKTGAVSPERLDAWRLQLLIYASLYRESFATVPVRLRVRSLQGGTHEFDCTEGSCVEAMESVRAGVTQLNARVSEGATAEELASPSTESCATCSHRAWCAPFWAANVPAIGGYVHLDGHVEAVEGWKVSLRDSRDGGTYQVDFAIAAKTPEVGRRLRIVDGRRRASEIVVAAESAVWGVPA